MTRRHGVEQVSVEEQRKYILELVIDYDNKGGISASNVIASYIGRFGIAHCGRGRREKKCKILDDLESFEKNGDIVFTKGKGNYFPTEKHKKDLEPKT